MLHQTAGQTLRPPMAPMTPYNHVGVGRIMARVTANHEALLENVGPSARKGDRLFP